MKILSWHFLCVFHVSITRGYSQTAIFASNHWRQTVTSSRQNETCVQHCWKTHKPIHNIFIITQLSESADYLILYSSYRYLAGKAAYFEGFSRIAFDAHTPNSLFTTTDVMRFRFRTSKPEGLIFYGGGNQGDYITMELWMGRLYVGINLGKCMSRCFKVSSILVIVPWSRYSSVSFHPTRLLFLVLI